MTSSSGKNMPDKEQKNKGAEDTRPQAGLTPLMQQYRDIKANYPETILFFRLGDFYEMFGEDAVKSAPLLEVVLTRRQSVPMCGIPYHAANSYIKKLIKAGEKVAVCEQLEEPGSGKGIVRRGVVRVITPGTLIEDNLLDAKTNNYLVSLYPSENGGVFGLAYVDVSTGEFLSTQVQREKLKAELFRVNPGEIIVPDSLAKDPFFSALCTALNLPLTALEGWHFAPSEAAAKVTGFFKLKSLKPLGLEDKPLSVSACGGIISYMEKTQGGRLDTLMRTRYYSTDDFLLLDENALRNLEIVEGSASRSKEDSLLGSVDSTLTSMGGRTLRQWILKPLLSRKKISERQSAVEFFIEDGLLRRNAREHLKNVSDVERILTRLSSFSAGPRELIALKNSLESLSLIASELQKQNGDMPTGGPESSIMKLINRLQPPPPVTGIIASSISDDPPALLKDGGVIREGFNPELDDLRKVSRESKNLISEMEQNERKKTGINSLKIGYTSVFGYYIEISKANLHLAGPDYVRKQTVTNGERFITPELKIFEEKILTAQEKISGLEDQAYKNVCGEVLGFAQLLQTTALAAAELDIYAAFAETAVLHNYSKPLIDDSSELEIIDGRHPVVERKIKSGSFVSNDTYINGESDKIILLTGPNMAGKSTYLRQVAHIVILAQAGSFVPCSKARVGVIDRIFTRIGAGDNLTGGESTFMVEMHETANILNQHTPRSLIILDEVGRGTSTYDGISIAWATVEYLSGIRDSAGRGPKVLFATHYFELTDLDGKLPGVKNYNVSVKEWEGEVIFLHKIVPGAADRSYGIHVAKLAGLPEEVITRAYGILSALEQKPVSDLPGRGANQLDFFSLPPSKFLIELNKLDVDDLTPLEALALIARWKKEALNIS